MHSDVKLGKLLGQGAFGEVRQGTLVTKNGKTVDVAVKLVRTPSTQHRREARTSV